MTKLWVCGGVEGSLGQVIANKAKLNYDDVLVTGHNNVDVTKAKQVDDFVSTYAPFDAVVYCSGINSLCWINDFMLEDVVMNTFDVNAFGFARVLNALSDCQVDEGGKVVAITSDAANRPMRGSLAYCASKAALECMIKVAARELAPKFQINGVAPSVIEDTNMSNQIDKSVPEFRGWTPQEAIDYEMSGTPMKRRATKDEIATVVLDVLGWPTYVSGAIIPVTGAK